MKALAADTVRRLRRLPPWMFFVTGLAYLLGLGWLNNAMPSGMSFGPSYIVAIAWAAWGAGTWPAIVLALVAVTEMTLIEHFSRPSIHPGIVVWNLTTRLAFCAGAGWLTAEATRLAKDLKAAIQEKTAALEREAREHAATLNRLRETLEWVEQVTNHINEVFWLSDVTKAQTLYVSRGYELIWGRPRSEVFKDPDAWLESIDIRERETIRRRSRGEQVAGTYDVEYRILRPDGQVLWIHDRAFPVRNEEGQVYRIAGIAEDVTARKRAETLLQAQRDLGLTLSLTSDLNSALATLLEVAVRLEGIDCAGVYLADAAGSLVLADHRGLSEQFVRSASCFSVDSDAAALVKAGRPVYTLHKNLGVRHDPVLFEERLRALAVLPLVHESQVLGCLNLASHTTDEIPRQTQSVLEAIAAQAAGAIARIRVTEALQRSQAQILEISDREHARLGQDIHDGLCQQLVSLAFDANALCHQLDTAGRPEAGTARRIADYLDQAITESRQLSRGLLPVPLDAQGLVSALEALAASTCDRFAVRCRFHCSPPGMVTRKLEATHLYRIAQEAVTNALKHGKPTEIDIRLLRTDGGLELTVENDGAAFSPPSNRNATGMGLQIMDYRARSIGASIRLWPRASGGAVLTCRLPLDPAAQRNRPIARQTEGD